MRLDDPMHGPNECVQEYQCNINGLSDRLTDMLTGKLINFEEIETDMSRIQKQLAELVEDLRSVSKYMDKEILEVLKEKNENENKLITDSIVESTSFIDKTNKTLALAELVSKYNLKKHSIVLDDSMKQDVLNIKEFLRSQETHLDSAAKVLNDKIKVLQETFINKLLKKTECVLQCCSQDRSLLPAADVRTLLHGKQTPDKTLGEQLT